MVWICIWMPTDTKTMKETENAYKMDDLLFLNRCADKFFSMSMKSVLFIQKRSPYAMIF